MVRSTLGLPKPGLPVRLPRLFGCIQSGCMTPRMVMTSSCLISQSRGLYACLSPLLTVHFTVMVLLVRTILSTILVVLSVRLSGLKFSNGIIQPLSSLLLRTTVWKMTPPTVISPLPPIVTVSMLLSCDRILLLLVVLQSSGIKSLISVCRFSLGSPTMTTKWSRSRKEGCPKGGKPQLDQPPPIHNTQALHLEG